MDFSIDIIAYLNVLRQLTVSFSNCVEIKFSQPKAILYYILEWDASFYVQDDSLDQI